MQKYKDLYKMIYSKTLERKNELSKINNISSTIFPVDAIETKEVINFSSGGKVPLLNSSAIYFYEDLLNDKYLIDRTSVEPHKIYDLVDFISRTKVGILIWDREGLVDPASIKVYVTGTDKIVFIVNRRKPPFLSVQYFKGIYSYARYNNNVDVVIPDRFKNSFMVWTKLPDSDSAAIEWIDPIIEGGYAKVPIRAQGGYSILLITEDIRFYNMVPQYNGAFSYISFPEEIGYTDVSNIFIWKNRVPGFTQPIFHTPLHDGVKLEDVYRTSLLFDGETGYVSFGSFPEYNEVTIHIRLKINTFGNYSQILQRGNSDGKGWSIRTTSDKRVIFQFKAHDESKNIASSVLNTGTWYDIVVTAKNNENTKPNIYVNKIRQNENIISNSAEDSETDELVLARQANEGTNYADIEVDLIQIYDKILRFTDIVNISNGIPIYTNLKHRWLMNENDGITVYDDIGNIDGELFDGVEWNHVVDDESPRLIAFSKRISFTEQYTDFLHKYNEYRDYMNEYLNNTLPQFVKDYEPYKPDVTMDTLSSEFRDKMVTASKDFPDFLKKYLEREASISFNTYDTSNNNPEFTRSSSATNVDGTYSILQNNIPRYIESDVLEKRGLIIEDHVSNKISDPLFINEILMDENESDNAANWSVSKYNDMLDLNVKVTNKTLRHTALSNNGKIRLNTPSMIITKSSPLAIQFKIKYFKDTSGAHDLWGYGEAIGESENDRMNLQSYLHTTYTDDDGYTYFEYRIPEDTFSGSGDRISFGLWGPDNGYDEKDYIIKEFQVTQTEHGGYTFTTVDKSRDLLKIPSKGVLNPSEGSFEIWFTPKIFDPAVNTRIVQTNIPDLSSRFIIYIQSNGSLRFAIAGTDSPSKIITSDPGIINPRDLYYICMTWKDQIMYAYINGQLIGIAEVGSDAIIGEFFYICADYNGYQINNSIVHDIRISNIRRSASEISSNYYNKNDLVIDEYTTYKLYYDSFNKTIRLPNDFMHPVKIITNHDLRKRLLFVNGLNISPAKCSYNRTTRKWTFEFRANDIIGDKIIEVDTGEQYEPYYETRPIESNTLVFGPSSHFSNCKEFDLFEHTPATEESQGQLRLMNSNEYILDKDENLITVELNDNVVALANTYQLPGSGESVKFSPDGRYVVTINQNSPILNLLKRVGDNLVLTDSYTLPSIIQGEGIAFSPDGEYIAVVREGSSPRFALFKIVDDSLVLASTYNIDYGCYGVDFSPDGTHIAVACYSVAGVVLLKRNGDSVEEVDSYLFENTSASARRVSFSPDGQYLAVTNVEDPGLCIFRLNDDELELITSYSTTFSAVGLRFAPNGEYLAVGYLLESMYGIYLFKFEDDGLELLDDYSMPNIALSIDFSHDSLYMATAGGSTTHQFCVFKIEDDSLNLIFNSRPGSSFARGVSFSIDDYIAVVHYGAPYLSLFKLHRNKLGKYICICERKYNKIYSENHSTDGLLQNLPRWVSFVPKERMIIFLNGRLLEQDRYYLFDPYRYTVVKGDTAIATDLDTNTVDGETFTGYFTTELELVEYNVELEDGQEIIVLNNKDLPFSKKYNLVFIDGKLIHPDDIKEIDNYRFSVNAQSINNMCIFRKKIEFTEKDKFSGIEDKWAEYLKTLGDEDLVDLIGPLNKVNDNENNSRSVYLEERHLFEILYHYCMKGRESLTEDDQIMIPIELPGTMLPDGRIPISTMRSGPYPRYPL